MYDTTEIPLMSMSRIYHLQNGEKKKEEKLIIDILALLQRQFSYREQKHIFTVCNFCLIVSLFIDVESMLLSQFFVARENKSTHKHFTVNDFKTNRTKNHKLLFSKDSRKANPILSTGITKYHRVVIVKYNVACHIATKSHFRSSSPATFMHVAVMSC